MENEAIRYIATVHHKRSLLDKLFRRQSTVWLIAHCNRLVSIDRVGDAVHFSKKEAAEAYANNFATSYSLNFVPGVMELKNEVRS
jgi:hypothetical protein